MDRAFEGQPRQGIFRARRRAVLLACAGLALILCLVAGSASSALSFAGPRAYTTGADPESVAIGDLNSDGKQDLVVANSGGRTVSLAAVLGVNANTVLRALRVLRNEGLLEFRRGRGVTVAGTPQRGEVVARAREFVVVARAREFVRFAREQGYRAEELVRMIEDLA